MRNRALFDIVALPARTAVGVVFIFHGWRKIQVGVNSTGKTFHSLGVPLPTASAVYSTFVELLGGTALIVGLGLPVAGVLLFLDMAGAFVFVNGGNGLFVADRGADVAHQGFELVLVLGLAGLLFAVGGGGELTLDRWLLLRRAARREEESYGQYGDGPMYPELHPGADDTDTLAAPAPPRRRVRRRAKPAPAPAPRVPADPSGRTPEIELPKPAEPKSRRKSAKTAAPEVSPDDSAESSESSQEKPRLVSEIIEDNPGDVLVAGRKWSRRKKSEGTASDA
jgi:putative oxidoreductase